MAEIRTTCPECGHEVVISSKDPILDAVRDEEFQKAVQAETAKAAARMLDENDALRSDLKRKDEEIRFLSEMRSRLSTKMVGESLEKHCEDEFNKIRAAAFPRATFGKDNDSRPGSKGDYIFRELDADGTEILSIMFEMKTEMQATSRKHKNEDFFRKLDEDRRKKGCEYAVLVTMLEADSDFYNAGIADLGYAYPKMYAVRPQCFLTIIGLLRGMALDGLELRRKAAEASRAGSGMDELEARIDAFKAGFLKDCAGAGDRFRSAISEIDGVILKLEKLKEALSGADRQVASAAKRAEGLSVRGMRERQDA